MTAMHARLIGFSQLSCPSPQRSLAPSHACTLSCLGCCTAAATPHAAQRQPPQQSGAGSRQRRRYMMCMPLGTAARWPSRASRLSSRRPWCHSSRAREAHLLAVRVHWNSQRQLLTRAPARYGLPKAADMRLAHLRVAHAQRPQLFQRELPARPHTGAWPKRVFSFSLKHRRVSQRASASEHGRDIGSLSARPRARGTRPQCHVLPGTTHKPLHPVAAPAHQCLYVRRLLGSTWLVANLNSPRRTARARPRARTAGR
jgi:hypothetical protein